MRVFEVVDVVQKQREENAGDDARDDRRRGRESDAFLRPRRFFCDTEEDEEDVKGSIFDIFSLSVFCARATTTTLLSLSLKEARFSLEFRMDFFQFISRHYNTL